MWLGRTAIIFLTAPPRSTAAERLLGLRDDLPRCRTIRKRTVVGDRAHARGVIGDRFELDFDLAVLRDSFDAFAVLGFFRPRGLDLHALERRRNGIANIRQRRGERA